MPYERRRAVRAIAATRAGSEPAICHSIVNRGDAMSYVLAFFVWIIVGVLFGVVVALVWPPETGVDR